jgi:Calcium binding
VVDVYDEWERAIGWFYYLEQTLHPIPGRVRERKGAIPAPSRRKGGGDWNVAGRGVCPGDVRACKLERSDARGPADVVARRANCWKDQGGSGGLGVLGEAGLPVLSRNEGDLEK